MYRLEKVILNFCSVRYYLISVQTVIMNRFFRRCWCSRKFAIWAVDSLVTVSANFWVTNNLPQPFPLSFTQEISAHHKMKLQCRIMLSKFCPLSKRIMQMSAMKTIDRGNKSIKIRIHLNYSRYSKVNKAGFLPLLVLARINNISDSDINFPAGETPPAESVLV